MEVFFEEFVVCTDWDKECNCGLKYHTHNWPLKAFFYKNYFSIENFKKKVKKLKNQNILKKSILIEMNDIDYEKHILVAYSILDNSKLIIKTNYLNYFALD